MRLLEIVDSIIEKHGSSEDFYIHMAREARRKGWDLAFAFPALGTPSVGAILRDEGAEVNVIAKRWRYPSGWLELVKVIRRFNSDVVHFHFCDLKHLPVFLFCRLTGRKVVFHYHGEIRPLQTVGWRRRHLSGVRICSWFCDRMVTVSGANERYLRATNIKRPIDLVYNGIDVSKFGQTESTGIAKDRDRQSFTLCSMGSLIPRKRVDDLLRGFAIVHAKRSDARLMIIGGGYLEPELKRLCSELNLDSAVEFKGKILDYPLELLRGSDLCVSASESESFGLIFAEAMCLGVPVVACRVGGIPDVVADGETGLLVSPRNPPAFAEAILKLMENDELRTQMAENAKEHVRSRFDLPDKVEALAHLLEDLIHAPGRRGTKSFRDSNSVPASRKNGLT